MTDRTERHTTAERCHCGCRFEGQDHCPYCACEQYERTCNGCWTPGADCDYGRAPYPITQEDWAEYGKRVQADIDRVEQAEQAPDEEALRKQNECFYCERQIPTNLCGMVKDQYGEQIGICCLSCKAEREPTKASEPIRWHGVKPSQSASPGRTWAPGEAKERG